MYRTQTAGIMRIGALILAAGFSSRMGELKAVLPLTEKILPQTDSKAQLLTKETNALQMLVALYTQAGISPLVVVTGYRAAAIQKHLSLKSVHCVHNATPEKGMLSSIQEGVRYLSNISDAFFLHPVDIPLVRPLTLSSLVQEAHKHTTATSLPLLIPTFHNHEGHPPLIPHSAYNDILAYQGEQGLRDALAHFPRQHIPVADSLILRDMDTPDDYRRLQKKMEKRHLLSPHEALELLHIHNVPPKGIAHGQSVATLAGALCRTLRVQAEYAHLSPRAAVSGGLTHDICKGEHAHEKAAGELFRSLNMPYMAWLVESHRDIPIADQNPITERTLVYLADKYVYGASAVPLKERFGHKLALFVHDPSIQQHITRRLSNACHLEKHFFTLTGAHPYALAQKLLSMRYPCLRTEGMA